MTLEDAKHCDGSAVCSFLGIRLFCCLQLRSTTKYVVVVADVEKKKAKKGLFQGLGFVMVFMGFFFSKGSYILNRLHFVHNPKITLNIKIQIQVCAFVIAVDFIER